MPETGLAIDKIGQDPSKRDCARIKMHINRMTSTEIDQLKVVTIGGTVKVTKQYVSLEGDGLIIELTAKPSSRFFLHHDKYGDSNIVDLNLEGNKEYRISAELKIFYPIVISCDAKEAEVFIDDTFQGRINDNYTLTVKDIVPGTHKLKVKSGTAVAEKYIDVNSESLGFRIDVNAVDLPPQLVEFRVTPQNATVVIDNKSYPYFEKGRWVMTLSNGSYNYLISADNYHNEAGTFSVGDAPIFMNVSLKPAYGWVTVESTDVLKGASVYIDNIYIGNVPVKSDILASGEHSIKIVKNLYHPHEATITIKDNETLKYTPSLSANFATVTLSTANGAGIYVNDKYKGTTTWTGDLETGLYIFEARKEGHRPTTLSKEISAKPQKQNITLESPTPITGYLNLTTSPTMASVKIDGKEIGESPLMEELLIGSHTVTASKKGYKVEEKTFTIKEGETTILPIALQEDIEPAKLSIYSTPGNADVYIDNTYVGETDTSKYVEAGTHKIKIKKSGYKKHTEKLTLTGGQLHKINAELKPTLLSTIHNNSITRISVGVLEEEEFCLGIDYNVILLGDEYLGIGVSAGLDYNYMSYLSIPILMTFDLGDGELGISFDIGTELSTEYIDEPSYYVGFGCRVGYIDMQLFATEDRAGWRVGVFF